MSFGDFRIFYLFLCSVLGLIIMSPTLAMFIELPSGESFSELWILGSDRMAEDYPLNVKAGNVYNISLGVVNHMGDLQFYMVCVKFRSQTDSPPNTTTNTPSPVPSLCTYYVFLRDRNNWETPLAFSFSNVSRYDHESSIGSLIVNDVSFSINKSAVWDSVNNGYYYQLFVELWIFNTRSKAVQFDNRFVSIWLNITEAE